MKSEDRDQLLDDLLEGDISEADFLRLEAEMIVDEDARVAYYNRLKLQSGLEKEAQAAAGAGASNSVLRRKGSFDPFLLAAVGALLLLVAVLAFKIKQDSAPQVAEEPVATGFGVIAELSAASWGNKVRISRGDLVPGKELHLESGVVRIELFNGVVIFLAGESEFALVSDREFRLVKGESQIRASGLDEDFTLTTPVGVVSGKGVFSVATTGSQTSVRIDQGAGIWNPTVNGKRSEQGTKLSGFETITGSVDGSLEQDVAPLLSNRDWEKELRDDRTERIRLWEKSRERLKKDQRLLVYFSMDESISDSSTRLQDLSVKKSDGSIIRAERSANRWSDAAAALDFTPTGSRVRLDIPGDHKSLTLMCWVKIDSLDRLYNSLFLTDGHELHEPHWQIVNDGRLFFSVRARQEKGSPDKHIAFSPSIWKPTDAGKWMHIATVFDGSAETITHYVNGEAVSIDQIPEELQPDKVTIGAASIGNWSDPRYRKDPEFVVRNLNGAIDEFAIFSEALDSGEVRKLYESGKL